MTVMCHFFVFYSFLFYVILFYVILSSYVMFNTIYYLQNMPIPIFIFHSCLYEHLKLHIHLHHVRTYRQDPGGYGLLYVDASQKANLGSSCSHSCNSNCTSAVVARNGRLVIVLTTVSSSFFFCELV